jgi:hypothetical protein
MNLRLRGLRGAGSEPRCQTDQVPFLDGQLIAETLLAFAMIAMLGLVLRWTFSHSRDAESALWSHGRSDDFGLLAAVATVDTLDEAQQLRSTLARAGVKATTVARDGRHQVLVFASDLDRARRLAN